MVLPGCANWIPPLENTAMLLDNRRVIIIFEEWMVAYEF